MYEQAVIARHRYRYFASSSAFETTLQPMVTTDELYEAVEDLSLEELRDLNQHVVELLRARRNAEQAEKIRHFTEGEDVQVVEDGEVKFTGMITRKKRTHVIIDTGDAEYDVPILLVEKLEA